MSLNPAEDGVTHINVYSKGDTVLGRFLSNFAYSPIETEDGKFCSIEGYWYWLSVPDERLRSLSGFQAKAYGRSIRAADWCATEEFKRKIRAAIKLKIVGSRIMLAKLLANALPLAHYYVWDGKAMQPPGDCDWIIDCINETRSVYLKGEK